MILFLAAQDIACLEVGLLDHNGRILLFQRFSVAPEEYLAAIARFFSSRSVSLETVEKIFVVSGPGSFTSTRMIVTIANALAFSKNIPITGVENATRKNSEELVCDSSLLMTRQEDGGFVTPTYDRPPHITLKK